MVRFLVVQWIFLLVLLAAPAIVRGRQFILIVNEQEGKENGQAGGLRIEEGDPMESTIITEDSDEWDGFAEPEDRDAEEFNSGSWRAVLEETSDRANGSVTEEFYISGLKKLMYASTEGEPDVMEEAVGDLQVAADDGNAHAQSLMGFLYGIGCGVEKNEAKAFLYHHFAAEGGSFQSKMAMAYNYYRQQMFEKSVKLYSELASVAVDSFVSSKESPLVEPVRIYEGSEENKAALSQSRGEEDDDFQMTEYQAQKGNGIAMFKLGIFYYFGIRGVPQDHLKAMSWFLKAVERGEYESMEFIGEIYARGSAGEKNYTKALDWFKRAVRHKYFSAYNGIGYLYVKGHGVEKKNFTKAREYFKRAAEHRDVNGHYNLGVLFLKGLGVQRNVKEALKHFVIAANNGQPKAVYQLAKMHQKGDGVKQDLASSATLYKLVAERGPWGSMLRWALECYLKGQTAKSLLLYSRVAGLGYEIAQSNAAWILDKYGDYDICIGKSGLCSDVERHQRAHSFWWRASEQGNEHAALLIGDAYYYGRGTDRDYERAAEAYMHAHSQFNAQAMFNLGYMHEHGEGLPLDLHLAKRYYDQSLEADPTAKLPVTLALLSIWIRMNYDDTFLVKTLDSLPTMLPELGSWLKTTLVDEGNITLVTLVVCLLTVLYLRERQRRMALQRSTETEVENN